MAAKRANPAAHRAADRDRAIALFRQIGDDFTEALILADRPVHPDAELLRDAGEALEQIREGTRLRAAIHEILDRAHKNEWRQLTGEERSRSDILMAENEERIAAAKTLLAWVRKRRAKTGAGIYAKALLEQFSRQFGNE